MGRHRPELFTTADNYLISPTNRSTAQPATAALLLTAGRAIDTLYKETRSQAIGTTTGDFTYTPGQLAKRAGWKKCPAATPAQTCPV